MKSLPEIDAIRERAILSSQAGFPFLVVFGASWFTAALLSYILPLEIAVWLYPLLGFPATAIAVAWERRVGYVAADKPDPLLPLALQINFVQVVAFPALLLVWDQKPAYLPPAFAAVVGAHFLPFQWIYRTIIYGVLGVLVALGPFVLVLFFDDGALHYTGFLVGTILLVGAYFVRSHAQRTWLSSQRAAQSSE